MKFRILIDKERCKGCELCVSVCTSALLSMSKQLNSKGYHYAERNGMGPCNGCQQCVQICPDAAIKLERVQDAAAADRPSKKQEK